MHSLPFYAVLPYNSRVCMVGYGVGSSHSTGYNNSFGNSAKGRSIPPPLASSTPRKGTANGASNSSFGSPGLKNGVSTPRRSDNGTGTDGSPSKKRKVVYMDEDEDDQGQSLLVGRTKKPNGVDKSQQNKSQKKKQEIQDQRRKLPIARGT